MGNVVFVNTSLSFYCRDIPIQNGIQSRVERDVIISECVDNWRGCSFTLQWVYIDILLPMFSASTLLLFLDVWTGKTVQFFLCTHILKLLLLVLEVLSKTLLWQNVWTGEGFRLSLYTHILILLLPTILDNVFITLNRIVPSDKSCQSLKCNSRAPLLKNLWHCFKNRNKQWFGVERGWSRQPYFILSVLILLSRIVCPPDQGWTRLFC